MARSAALGIAALGLARGLGAPSPHRMRFDGSPLPIRAASLRQCGAFVAVLLLGCGEPPVDVFIDVEPCAREAGARIEIEVRDGSDLLVDRFTSPLASISLPTGVRIRPRDESSTSWHVVATLYTAEDVPIGFESARGRFADGAPREIGLAFDDACLGIECPSGETCVASKCVSDLEPERRPASTPRELCPPIVFVDGAGGADSAECGPIDAPCASPQQALDNWIETGRGAVVHVKEGTYTATDGFFFVVRGNPAEGVFQRGGPESPIVIKRWPGFGVPLVDGARTAVAGVMLHGSHTILDGFAITGGVSHGISINGSWITDVTVRRCELYANGHGQYPDGTKHTYDDRGNLVVNNNASHVLIEDVVMRDAETFYEGEFASGMRVNGSSDVTVRRTSFRGNERVGIFLSSSQELAFSDIELAGNADFGVEVRESGLTLTGVRICGSGRSGVFVTGSSDVAIRRASIVTSGSHAIELDSQARPVVESNILAFNTGDGIFTTDSRVRMTDSHNLYYDNTAVAGNLAGRAMPDTDVEGDPGFSNVAECDLTLAADSPARGAGPGGGDLGAP